MVIDTIKRVTQNTVNVAVSTDHDHCSLNYVINRVMSDNPNPLHIMSPKIRLTLSKKIEMVEANEKVTSYPTCQKIGHCLVVTWILEGDNLMSRLDNKYGYCNCFHITNLF